MSSRFVIDTIVQQTTILVAQLATAKGIRAPLSHVADQVFLELANSIEEQGVPRKVAADMFGMALRSYQLKVQRLEESASERDRSLWEAVYDFIADNDVVQRAEVLTEFCYDDGASVRSILNDLVETGLVFQSGSRRSRSYRAASAEEMATMAAATDRETLSMIIWVHLYRSGPQSTAEITDALGGETEHIEEAIDSLHDSGRVSQNEANRWVCAHCVIPRDTKEGWEAALIDHFQAVVVAMSIKLRQMANPTLPSETVGGSTYSFDLHDEHPHRDQVRALLKNTRDEISELAETVREYNEEQGRDKATEKVTFYFGQSIADTDHFTNEDEKGES